ncbi:1-deoxy-D-xylulose-5-phosphate synthase [Helicobacter sp. 10-6591]|uniref:1-deoxy-D-xylulose-5-phosphate synthase n=1 Tax=Helicobacter sp. 10-6591 TaxID=2004998 RepID=UPI00215CBB36|nr:1-deoxy-D-xylulose-5-phosphate synthase [Helicobacter sp. 10-6591]
MGFGMDLRLMQLDSLKQVQQNTKDLLDTKAPSKMNKAELEALAYGIRARILDVVSTNGGHLSSTLGAVELIIGMHVVFDWQINPFIFDVSHQAYAHKLLTNRWEEFATLRSFGGLSGFCNPKESKSDYFIAGHSSTSISLAVGATKSFKLQKQDRTPIVLIGDGSMSAGLVYEALNELGARKYPVIIILNDNEMSISKPIGAISNYLSQILATPTYQGLRAKVKNILTKMPESASYLAKRFEESIKLITPGLLFEELGLDYIGPIDGHNLELIISTLQKAKEMKNPVIIHAQTTKGKGYEIAEGRFEKWHGVSPFDLQTGKTTKSSTTLNPTQVFSQTLLQLAKNNPKIVGVTAAMPSGTGLDSLIAYDSERFWDIAIAEPHAVTSMAAMAKEGFIPFVAIYSTFLQRAFDSIVHDVSIMSLPVRFAIDRAGIVGEDGETHQGLLDIAYLRIIPNMVVFAPRDNATLEFALKFAAGHDTTPCAFRYPRGKFVLQNEEFGATEFRLGKAEVLQTGKDVLLIGYGNGVGRAYETSKILQSHGISAGILDLRFVKPLDEQCLKEQLAQYSYAFVLSDSYYLGGVGSAILESNACRELNTKIVSLELKDSFVSHGKSDMVETSIGLDSQTLAKHILDCLSRY